MKKRIAIWLLVLILGTFAVTAQQGGLNRAEAATASTAAKCGTSRLSLVKYFKSSVSIMCDSNYMYVSTLEIPNEEMMVGITGWNQQVPLPFIMSDALTTLWKIPLKPKWSSKTTKTTGVGATGLLINGVPLFNATKPSKSGDQSSYIASADPLLLGELDHCDGHAGRGDDYHYHAYPACLVNTLVTESRSSKAKNWILGWALDGYPIYGLTEPNGQAMKKLDACQGHVIDKAMGYHYHFTTKPPYSPMCFHGVVPSHNLPEHQPTAAAARPAGGPAKVLITEMAFDLEGESVLRFVHNGIEGSVTYSRMTSQDANQECWQFTYVNPPSGSPGTGTQVVCRKKFGKGS